MCEYFCIGFFDFMLKGKSLLDYTNLFSPNEYEKNDKMILKYLRFKVIKKYCVICCKYRKFKNCKILNVFEKTLVLSMFCSKFDNKYEKNI